MAYHAGLLTGLLDMVEYSDTTFLAGLLAGWKLMDASHDLLKKCRCLPVMVGVGTLRNSPGPQEGEREVGLNPSTSRTRYQCTGYVYT